MGTQPSSSALRIAVMGAGRIGSAFAFQLARNGHKVTAIARAGSARLRELERHQGIVDDKGQRADVRVLDALDEETPYDLILVTVLAHQVDAVLPALTRSAAKCVQFMFNTFDPERLRDAVGAHRASFGMPFVQADIDSDGKLRATIGAAGQKTLMSEQRWVDLFIAAGLPAALEPDMMLWLRCHVPLCVAFESICIAGQRRGGGASWAEAMVVARGTQESFALIRELGYRLYPSGKAWLARLPTWMVATVFWSISRITSFRELLATGGAECSSLVDKLVATATGAIPAASIERIAALRPSPATHGA